MASLTLMQARGGLAIFAAYLAAPFDTAQARAHNLTFDGNPLWIAGIIVAVVVIFWLLIVGSLRSDRRDRGRASSRADRGGSFYAPVGDDDDEDSHHFIH